MDPFVLIIFGISGNLAQNKLLPALYDMINKGLLSDEISILGSARKLMNDKEFQDQIVASVKKNRPNNYNQQAANHLARITHYIQGDLTDISFYTELKNKLGQMQENSRTCNNHMYYLATYPSLYSTIFQHLETAGLNKQDCGWVRLMIEKPLGNSVKSAEELNRTLSKYYMENQIFRLDHYLGKETVQNILAFRFGNGLFEPLMGREHVDHIQITSSEEIGVLGRGSYYDQFGALKDVGQNHLLQMLAFSVMDEPARFDNPSVTRERLRIITKLTAKPEDLVLGQYIGYRNEFGIDPASSTDTFFALKTTLTSPRFNGVPVYLRAGKKLQQTVTEISIVFKPNDHDLFKQHKNSNGQNVLIFRIQPNEAIVIKMMVKKPGRDLALEPAFMQFCYHNLADDLPDPYENLLLNAIEGEQTFFNDATEVEEQWRFIEKFAAVQHATEPYSQGSWGPAASFDLIKKDNREWLEPSMEFCQI